MKQLAKLLLLGFIYGCIYVGIELLWRGYSHPSMIILGGLCGVCIGLLNECMSWDLGFVWQALLGGGITTGLELITGLIVNVWLGLGVWDYSNLPLHFMGQICVPFYFAWVGLAVVAILIDDWMRYLLFGEERPRYKMV